MNEGMTVVVVGLGRIGLPTALLVAESKYAVCGFDIDSERIDLLNRRCSPFVEPGLDARLSETKATFTDKLITADLYIVAVSTLSESGIFEVDKLQDLVRGLFNMSPESIVIIESTLPLGGYASIRNHVDGKLVYCPERVAPGLVFEELATVDRAIAADDVELTKRVKSFYHSLGINTVVTLPEIAEMVKLAENAYRDSNIAFANALADLCGEKGIDSQRVIEIANSHPRVSILRPGLGAGGACIAPSTRTLSKHNQAERGQDFFTAIRESNSSQVEKIADQVAIAGVRRVALWGVSYKKNSDDVRYSRAMVLKALMEEKGIEVRVWDPLVKIGDKGDTLSFGEALVFGIAHDVFRTLDPAEIASKTHIKRIFDFVGAIDREQWQSVGFSCICA